MTASPEMQLPTDSRWRPVRRALVGAFAASTAAVMIAGFLELEPGWLFNLVSFSGMLQPVTALTLLALARFVPMMPDDKLDERLRLARDRAYRVAYNVFISALLSVLLALHIRAWLFDWLPTSEGISRWAVGAAMLAIATPAAVMVWTESER
jgi:hypothetical protein